jgi:TetR/AcrR family transcriptional regulator
MTAGHGDTRDRILKQALGLFSSRGYDAVSVREICTASGITKPTLYHFFGSKEGLYRALLGDALARFRQELRETLAAPGTTAERLARVSRAYFRVAREQRDLVRFLIALVHGPATAVPTNEIYEFYGELVSHLARVVEEGVARGECAPGPTDVRMLVFMGGLTEALTGYVLRGQPVLTPELADVLTESILAGWRSE